MKPTIFYFLQTFEETLVTTRPLFDEARLEIDNLPSPGQEQWSMKIGQLEKEIGVFGELAAAEKQRLSMLSSIHDGLRKLTNESDKIEFNLAKVNKMEPTAIGEQIETLKVKIC